MKRNVWFWIITVLCIVAILLSPVLLYVLDDKHPGAFVFGGGIILWTITIILHEHNKQHK